jgi:hypothetical protein
LRTYVAFGLLGGSQKLSDKQRGGGQVPARNVPSVQGNGRLPS